MRATELEKSKIRIHMEQVPTLQKVLKRLRAGGGSLRADLRSSCLGEPPKAAAASFSSAFSCLCPYFLAAVAVAKEKVLAGAATV